MLVRVAFFFILAFVFLGLIGMQLLGRQIGARRLARDPGSFEGMGAVEGTLLALLGLLVAFTLSGALDRLQARRKLIVDEANAIGTTYLRLDLLPPGDQPRLREELRRYADARIALYENLLNFNEAKTERQRGTDLRRQIWADAMESVGQGGDSRTALLLVPALNEMFDLTTAREAALRTHVPPFIFVLLILLSLVCAFFAGLGMAKSRRPSRLHIFAFAGLLGLTAYVILNLEFPRAGFVRLEAVDALLAQVRAAMA